MDHLLKILWTRARQHNVSDQRGVFTFDIIASKLSSVFFYHWEWAVMQPPRFPNLPPCLEFKPHPSNFIMWLHQFPTDSIVLPREHSSGSSTIPLTVTIAFVHVGSQWWQQLVGIGKKKKKIIIRIRSPHTPTTTNTLILSVLLSLYGIRNVAVFLPLRGRICALWMASSRMYRVVLVSTWSRKTYDANCT